MLIWLMLIAVDKAKAKSSLGIYLRDISQIMPSVTSVLMFLTPIFYPATAIPKGLRSLFEINPIGWGAEALRAILLEQKLPSINALLLHGVISLVMLVVARYVFIRLEKGFSDVL